MKLCIVMSPIVNHILIEHLKACDIFVVVVSKGVLRVPLSLELIFSFKKLGKACTIWIEFIKMKVNNKGLSR